MTDEQAQINAAIENLPGSYLSQDDQVQIAARYGEDIAAKVKSLYDAAISARWIGAPKQWTMDLPP